MTGLLSILLLMLLPQAENLPGLTGIGPGALLPGVAGSKPTSGWEVDPQNSKFTFIIQIPPSAISDFAQGPSGNELSVPIEDRLVGRVEQIAIRFDTKDLPKIDPPNVGSRSQASVQPTIQNLALMRYAPQLSSGMNQWENMVGWQFDNQTNRYSYIIQIPVASLQQFITGPTGQEMIVPLHRDVMDFVEQVTVRIGSGALPKDSAPRSVLDKYQVALSDNIRTLDGRSGFGAPMVSIDPTPVSGGTDLGQGRGSPNAILPEPPLGTGGLAGGSDLGSSRSNGGAVLPGNNQPNYINANNLGSTNNPVNQSNPPPGYRPQIGNDAPSLDNARRASERDLLPAPQNRMAENMFGRLDSRQSNPNPNLDRFSSANDPRMIGAGQGIVPGQQDRSYLNNPPQYMNTMTNAYPQIAANPNTLYSQTGYGNVPTSTALGNMPNNTITPASMQNVVGSQTSLTNNPTQSQGQEKKSSSWPLAALVLLGFNIYQFFWMSNARIKYRQMVISKRGTRLEPTA